jgi:hypothetical protein
MHPSVLAAAPPDTASVSSAATLWIAIPLRWLAGVDPTPVPSASFREARFSGSSPSVLQRTSVLRI